jgi:hypothetical protein
VGQVWGWVEFSGTTLFTVFVKGAGFSFMRNTPREERPDRNRPAGKGESRIGKPALLNTARVRHPPSQGLTCARSADNTCLVRSEESVSLSHFKKSASASRVVPIFATTPSTG